MIDVIQNILLNKFLVLINWASEESDILLPRDNGRSLLVCDRDSD